MCVCVYIYVYTHTYMYVYACGWQSKKVDEIIVLLDDRKVTFSSEVKVRGIC